MQSLTQRRENPEREAPPNAGNAKRALAADGCRACQANEHPG